ncbi:MAG: hypothetical protein KGR26_16880 [Cyanobacteria bacterium REEB65]|nr:hypothetical protein [Cyanobacteria bacterium REEB65]
MPDERCTCPFPLLDDDVDAIGDPDDEDDPICWRCHRPVLLNGDDE